MTATTYSTGDLGDHARAEVEQLRGDLRRQQSLACDAMARLHDADLVAWLQVRRIHELDLGVPAQRVAAPGMVSRFCVHCGRLTCDGGCSR